MCVLEANEPGWGASGRNGGQVNPTLKYDPEQLVQMYGPERAAANPGGVDLAVVVADGLSALAVHKHTLPFLTRMEEQTHAEGWSLSPVILVEQGRVAVADEIGQLLGAKMVVILIGERPGLSSPDSLGLYFTYNPKVGLTDAYRNCISNVRLEGLSYGMAAHRLLYLMKEACRRQLSGVNLKDEAQVQTLDGKVARHFIVKDQRITSRSGVHPAPAFAIAFKDAAYGFATMQAKNKQLAFMTGIQDKAEDVVAKVLDAETLLRELASQFSQG